MKTIDYYLNLPYKLEIVPDMDEGGFAARYPELPGCITVGDTLEAVVKNVNGLLQLWKKETPFLNLHPMMIIPDNLS